MNVYRPLEWRWEYTVLEQVENGTALDLREDLELYGRQGWELCAQVTVGYDEPNIDYLGYQEGTRRESRQAYVFKRRVQNVQ